MVSIGKRYKEILDKCLQGIPSPGYRKIDNTNGVYMPLSVERLSDSRVSIAHYVYMNGDAVPDPDMEFWISPEGDYYPIGLQLRSGTYTRAITKFDDRGKPVDFIYGTQRCLAAFANMWLNNIKEQQRL